MRSRLRNAVNGVGRVAATLGRGLVAVIGPGELLLVVGLAMVAAALWPVMGRLALLPVGVVLVWIALPSRTGFLVRQPAPAQKPKRTR